MTDDSVHVVLHCYDEAISLLDNTVVEENLKLHPAVGFEDRLRVRAGVLHPEGVVVVADSETLRANVVVAEGLASRVLFLFVER